MKPRRLAGLVRLFPHYSDSRPATARITEDAVVRSEVVEITYEDRQCGVTTREVEPLALVGYRQAWYLVGHTAACGMANGPSASTVSSRPV